MKLNKKIGIILLIFSILFAIFSSASNAANVSLSASSTSVTVGTKVTIKLSGTAAAWDLYIRGDGISEKAVVGFSDKAENTSFSDEVSFTPNKAGTYTITLTGKIVDETETEGSTVSRSVTVTVKEKTTSSNNSGTSNGNTSTSNNNTSSSNNSGTSTTTKPEAKPNFTNATRTVYTTGEVNLRDSWSTSSKAILVKEGTELKLTATSTNTVNGYVWYRVEYNGATKYIASSLITNKKPEEKKEDEKKSDNNNLSSLTIKGVTLSPEFSKDVLQYTAKAEKEITKLEVDAKAENSKAKVKIEGNEELQDGENKVRIAVTAEDGTTKNYTITVTKGEVVTTEPIDTDGTLKLAEFKIAGVTFENGFDPDTYYYKIPLAVIMDELTITAEPNQEDATVEILGNGNFKEGENMVTIILTSKDGMQTATYQIEVVVPGAEAPKQTDIQLHLIIGGVAIAVAIMVVAIIIVRARSKDDDDDWDDIQDEFEDKKSKKLKNAEENEEQDDEEDGEEEDEEEEKELVRNVKKGRKVTIDEFLDTSELDEPKPRRSRGKHSV